MPNDEELLGRVLKKYSIGMKCRGHAACIDMESAEDPAEVVPAASAPSKRFSRSKLTRSLEIAREAVQFDSANDPKAAISSYGRALALLREVISRSDSEESRTEIVPRRRASAKEEANRLQTIANTYQDRMNVLSLIHGIPIPEFPKDDDAERMAPALEDRPSSPGLLGAPSSSESASVSLASSVQALDLQTKSVLDHHEPANVRTD
ncbi:hypothetical protein C8R44DRAFT_761540 [Mycena epipterygia]|nr:hypothetical protein C8R44DRAFT_761540 [Mycena epipterygia]